MDTHWFGGPDLIVEIVSDRDASYEKLEFYSRIGVREALIVDRDPWALELDRLDAAGKLLVVGRAELGSESVLRSEVVDADLSLITRNNRPGIAVSHSASGRSWFAAGSAVR